MFKQAMKAFFVFLLVSIFTKRARGKGTQRYGS